MRTTIFGWALASSMLATPALAQDTGPYAGIEGGAVWADEIDDSIDIFEDEDTDEDLIALDTDTGWEAGAIVGYDFGRFRLEGEGAYKRIGVDSISAPNGGIDLDPTTPGVIDSERELDGDLTVKSLMANALVDFGSRDTINFYAGGGAGYSWVDIDSEFDLEGDANPEQLFNDDNDSGFSWQLIAGLRFPVTRDLDLGVKYRFFNVENLGLRAADGSDFDADLRTHSALATLTYNFGRSAPPPA
ncbi:outer membrane beta-barrel protein [Erythrobacter sp.]|uniref:outer membrane protein n=1 Tax=Erythrobacter sp. TaxID=1042 RepID=UPI002600AB25|nr:outer membrane beta-barrel protein [Erythrobacter sp.]